MSMTISLTTIAHLIQIENLALLCILQSAYKSFRNVLGALYEESTRKTRGS